jgi:hypothetical protein
MPLTDRFHRLIASKRVVLIEHGQFRGIDTDRDYPGYVERSYRRRISDAYPGRTPTS